MTIVSPGTPEDKSTGQRNRVQLPESAHSAVPYSLAGLREYRGTQDATHEHEAAEAFTGAADRSSPAPSSAFVGYGIMAEVRLRPVGGRKDLPRTTEDVARIWPADIPPTVVARDERGMLLVWQVEEDSASIEPREVVAERLHVALRYRAAFHGWGFDEHPNIGHIELENVHLLRDTFTGRVYTFNEIRAVVADCPTRAERERQFAEYQREWRDPVVDPDATVSQAVLDDLESRFPTFRATWSRQRPDLQPKNQPYDLTLVVIGTEAGLDQQTVIDLVVHHRRLQGQKTDLRDEHFTRLFAKAKNFSDAKGEAGVVEASNPESGNSEAELLRILRGVLRRGRCQLAMDLTPVEFVKLHVTAKQAGSTLRNHVRDRLGLTPRYRGRPDPIELARREDEMWQMLKELGLDPRDIMEG